MWVKIAGEYLNLDMIINIDVAEDEDGNSVYCFYNVDLENVFTVPVDELSEKDLEKMLNIKK
jgi:hypothetical protein